MKKERILGGELQVQIVDGEHQVRIVDVELQVRIVDGKGQVRIVDVELQVRIVDGKGQVWTKHFQKQCWYVAKKKKEAMRSGRTIERTFFCIFPRSLK